MSDTYLLGDLHGLAFDALCASVLFPEILISLLFLYQRVQGTRNSKAVFMMKVVPEWVP